MNSNQRIENTKSHELIKLIEELRDETTEAVKQMDEKNQFILIEAVNYLEEVVEKNEDKSLISKTVNQVKEILLKGVPVKVITDSLSKPVLEILEL